MLVEFSKISDESKVWIYSSEKKLNMNQIEEEIGDMTFVQLCNLHYL